jgi:hypothetical protein
VLLAVFEREAKLNNYIYFKKNEHDLHFILIFPDRYLLGYYGIVVLAQYQTRDGSLKMCTVICNFCQANINH